MAGSRRGDERRSCCRYIFKGRAIGFPDRLDVEGDWKCQGDSKDFVQSIRAWSGLRERKTQRSRGWGGMKPNSNISTHKSEAVHLLRPPASRVFYFSWEIKTHKVTQLITF